MEIIIQYRDYQIKKDFKIKLRLIMQAKCYSETFRGLVLI